ncbi:collagen alpha-1(III) chain-like isoform X9 [Aquila chrysaetos chrysaetos]|uniref:collagen alpha-1(III) chain-like isoform X9 n=1 Tax=Aquila chrysaetos chrysaetos TaxID=223781 RepID=UPI0011768096|nr:collagen alpha-1(III) chain-like isoform X9 [Aquila chrysaetos chrysaetos]
MMRAELKGQNGTSCPPQGGASAARGQAGIPPGNGAQQGADPGAGPAAPGAKLGGSAHGPTAADSDGAAGIPMMRAELKGQNGTSCPPQGGASAARGQAGIPPGNGAQQGADPGAGPAAPGAKLGGSAHGPTAADSDGAAGIPMMRAELKGQNGTSCPPQGGASAARGQAGIPPGNGAQQGADPGAGPAAPGAKLGGSAHGPTAADSDGAAGIPMMRAELKGQNGTSCPPQGGASAARGQAGIPPGNGAQQGADPGAGPAAPGAKLGGSAHGPTAADSDGAAGIPMMRAELKGQNGTSCPPQGGADPGAGPAAPGAKLGGSAHGPTAADSDGAAGIPMMRAELKGQNGTSCPPQGGASAARGQAGIPPGNGAQQGADPGAGPAAPGAKLGGSAHGPTAADSDGAAGIPMMRAELKGQNGTSCPPQGGASAARGQAGIPPGNGAQQGADPGAGPAAPGAKLGGSAHGPTAADSDGAAGIPMMRAELKGQNGTSCPPQGGASAARGQAGIPPGNGAQQGADPGAGPAAPGAKLGGSAHGPTAADSDGAAGIPMMRAELKGQNGTSCPPQGGASAARGQAGIPPGNGAQQGADPGAGPAAPGAKLGGSAHGPTAADSDGAAGIPMMRAELKGQNGTSCPPQGGASAARGQAGIPPGNGAQQGADPGAGPAAPGAKLGGSAHGPTAADSDGAAGIPMMRAELKGQNGTSCPPQGGASAARGQAGIPPGNGAQQGADPGAGPAAPGAKLGGSAHGPTAADSDGAAGIPMMRAELKGQNGTSCPPQGGADPGAGPAAPGAKLGGSAHGPTAADSDGAAGIPMMRAELKGQNGTSCPPQGGASAARGQAGIPPGNGAQQGADPGAGPAAPGAKLGGSAHGPTAADSDGAAGIPMMRAELKGQNGTSCPPQGGADPGAGPAAVPGAGPGSTSYQEGKCSARPRPTPAGAAQRAQGHRRPSRWCLCGC